MMVQAMRGITHAPDVARDAGTTCPRQVTRRTKRRRKGRSSRSSSKRQNRRENKRENKRKKEGEKEGEERRLDGDGGGEGEGGRRLAGAVVEAPPPAHLPQADGRNGLGRYRHGSRLPVARSWGSLKSRVLISGEGQRCVQA
jgi:hypothetical protein